VRRFLDAAEDLLVGSKYAMKRIIVVVAILVSWPNIGVAQQCAEDVLKVLYEELETIDSAGEERLAQSLDSLAQQEGWSESERSDFTLSISDNPDVDAVESERTDMLARIFGLARHSNVDCTEIHKLHAAVLDLERQQWEAAVKQVEQRIWR